MASALGSVVLSEEKLKTLIHRAKQWALLYGVQMRKAEDPSNPATVDFAPMTLFPSLLPRAIFEEAKSLQIHFQRLMHRAAHDHAFLVNCFKTVIQVDEFTRKMWEIYLEVQKQGLVQPLSLGLFRNDFMMDTKKARFGKNPSHEVPDGLELKQIEFNAIASSFGGLICGQLPVHRQTLASAGVEVKDGQLPENKPARGLAAGLLKAWEHYNVKNAVILFLVSQVERNSQDQVWLECQIFEQNPAVHVVFATFQDLIQKGTLNEDRKLFLEYEEIAVIYFRYGYVPNNYTTEKDYNIRLTMELSRAIKCPSIHYQLVGCKKVQQELARPGVLEHFIQDPSIVSRIRATFAGQYSLDMDSEGNKAVEMAISSPSNYVLKPQREGGGNNLYGEEMKNYLIKIRNSEERQAYILMERIHPWQQKNHLLKLGMDPSLQNVVSEIGIYGVCLGSADQEICNVQVGHLLRTKSSSDNEGGIVAGFATVDTPLLVD
ncbi:hypothetical protein CHS0354_030570 [Potamilus streckersoni]|uniref:Glutathione synthetase n=1 Tax=Potamilus streckersoni TaxID=2493646 RepID=A0AAE0VNB3_9BIVA|nr:hypothetical protein CHS0354_030570 [Potamilus streckersoni]